MPVLTDRIASDDDLVEVTVQHIARACADDGASRADPSLFLLDSGYPAARITHLLRDRDIPADVLVRLATSQTMWTRPEHRAAHPLGGRPRRHGFRLALREPDLPADTGISGPLDIYGTVTVRAWHQVHPSPNNHENTQTTPRDQPAQKTVTTRATPVVGVATPTTGVGPRGHT